jgi:hypothetical protein
MFRVLALAACVLATLVALLVLASPTRRGARPSSANISKEEAAPIRTTVPRSVATMPQATLPAVAEGSPEDPMDDRPHIPNQSVMAALAGQTDISAERAALKRALTASGPSSQEWTVTARSLFSEWSTQLVNTLPANSLRIDDVACYNYGCIAEMSYDTRSSHRQALDDSNHYFPPKWRGMRVYTGAEAGENGLHASLILVAPKPR